MVHSTVDSLEAMEGWLKGWGVGRGSLVPRLSPTLAERAWECSVKGLGRYIWTFIGCKKWFHFATQGYEHDKL